MAITFNPQNRNYYDGSTRIPRDQIRTWVDQSSSATADKLRAIGQDFLDGKINSAQAEIDATELITKHHSAIAVIANGGRDQMDAASWGRVGPVVKDERDYMSGLWRDYGNEDVSDAQLMNRLGMYGDGGGRSFENLRSAYARAAGFDQVINVSGDTSAPCNECDELSAAGAMPMDDMVPIGERECGPNCGCSIEIAGVDDIED